MKLEHRFPQRLVRATALALPLALMASAGWTADPYANDGARQTSDGGWQIPYDQCAQDTNLSAYATQSACTTAGFTWGWDPIAQVDKCFYNRFQCNGLIRFGLADGTNGGPGDVIDDNFNSQGECETAGYEWRAGPSTSTGACSDGAGRNQSTCLATAGNTWYSPACRGRFYYDASYGFGSFTSSQAREDCTRCHNNRHYPAGYPDAERGVGDTYIKTGHKNMLRPYAPNNSDYHYISGAPWLNNAGNEIVADASGHPINSAARTINVGGSDLNLYWIYDWIMPAPTATYDGASYTCGSCHTTGYVATDDTTKQPYLMFGSTDPQGAGKTTGSWDQWGIQCSRCHGAQISATSNLQHHSRSLSDGAKVTQLCSECHHQTGYVDQDADPAGILKVGASHGALAFFGQFIGHTQGNLYLNSPHAKFSGTTAQMGDITKYASHFMTEGEFAPELGGCTGCHNVHKSAIKSANPDGGAIAECTECHGKDLNTMKHPKGVGTPFENMASDPQEACATCHMPGELHLFRINVDPSYTTVPIVAILNGTDPSNASTAPDGTYTKAVWNDLDMTCGQCHGGGIEYVDTAGVTTSGSKDVTVTSPVGFAIGQRVRVVGGGSAGANLDTFVKAVDLGTNTVTLYGAAGATLSGVEVIQNPTKNGAGYISKARLAALAKGIHNDASVAKFSATLGSPNTLIVNVNGSASVCQDTCDVYTWNWGDGSSNTVYGNPASSHTYGSSGPKTITLTVTDYGFQPGTASKIINTYTPDLPPSFGQSDPCSFDANTWTLTIDGTLATDDHGVKQEVVNWGDGSLVANSLTKVVFNHTFTKAGIFPAKITAVDTIGQGTSVTCMAMPAYFTISGTLFRSNGTTPVYSAKIIVLKGASVVKTVYSLSDGSYSVGNLKPGNDYQLVISKTGYTFPPESGLTVGPNLTLNVSANTP